MTDSETYNVKRRKGCKLIFSIFSIKMADPYGAQGEVALLGLRLPKGGHHHRAVVDIRDYVANHLQSVLPSGTYYTTKFDQEEYLVLMSISGRVNREEVWGPFRFGEKFEVTFGRALMSKRNLHVEFGVGATLVSLVARVLAKNHLVEVNRYVKFGYLSKTVPVTITDRLLRPLNEKEPRALSFQGADLCLVMEGEGRRETVYQLKRVTEAFGVWMSDAELARSEGPQSRQVWEEDAAQEEEARAEAQRMREAMANQTLYTTAVEGDVEPRQRRSAFDRIGGKVSEGLQRYMKTGLNRVQGESTNTRGAQVKTFPAFFGRTGGGQRPVFPGPVGMATSTPAVWANPPPTLRQPPRIQVWDPTPVSTREGGRGTAGRQPRSGPQLSPRSRLYVSAEETLKPARGYSRNRLPSKQEKGLGDVTVNRNKEQDIGTEGPQEEFRKKAREVAVEALRSPEVAAANRGEEEDHRIMVREERREGQRSLHLQTDVRMASRGLFNGWKYGARLLTEEIAKLMVSEGAVDIREETLHRIVEHLVRTTTGGYAKKEFWRHLSKEFGVFDDSSTDEDEFRAHHPEGPHRGRRIERPGSPMDEGDDDDLGLSSDGGDEFHGGGFPYNPVTPRRAAQGANGGGVRTNGEEQRNALGAVPKQPAPGPPRAEVRTDPVETPRRTTQGATGGETRTIAEGQQQVDGWKAPEVEEMREAAGTPLPPQGADGLENDDIQLDDPHLYSTLN